LKSLNKTFSGIGISVTKPFVISKTAFKNFLTQYELRNLSEEDDLIKFFIHYKKDIKKLIKNLLENFGAIKVQMCIQVTFIRDDNNITTNQISYFCTSSDFVSHISLWSDILNIKLNELENMIQEFTLNGSDWRL
jgi:hypothetical protein